MKLMVGRAGSLRKVTAELRRIAGFLGMGLVCGMSVPSVPAWDDHSPGRPGAAGQRWDPYLRMYDYRVRFYNPSTGVFTSPDTFEGLDERPASQHRYRFVEGDPINKVDPSGHLSLTEVETSMAEQFKLGADAVSTVYRGYNTAMNVIDAVETFRAFAQIVYDGNLSSSLKTIQGQFAAMKVRYTGQQIADEFMQNFAHASPYIPSHWAPPIFLDMTQGNRIQAFLIYLPTPLKMDLKVVPTGLKVGKYKLALVAGGEGVGRLTGVGLKMDINHKQFFRMDFHALQANHGNYSGTGARPKANDELAVWEDLPFHYHVMQYRGKSNR